MKIFDAHNDFLTSLKTNMERIDYIKEINKNKNIKKVCAVVWTTKIKNIEKYIKNLQNNVLCRVNCKKILLCFEDLGFINKHNFDDIIKILLKIKPLYCGLTWNYNNSLGGGAFGDGGLTILGKRVVEELEKNNIIVDTAHMNAKTFNDFAKISTKPIFNSHTNLLKLYWHKRNLSDKQISLIKKSNGLFCMCFVKNFMSNKQIDVNDIAKQISYFINKFGSNNLAIGTDFFGTKNLPKNLIDYNDFKNLRKRLKKNKVKNNEIKKIFYKNISKFLNQ